MANFAQALFDGKNFGDRAERIIGAKYRHPICCHQGAMIFGPSFRIHGLTPRFSPGLGSFSQTPLTHLRGCPSVFAEFSRLKGGCNERYGPWVSRVFFSEGHQLVFFSVSQWNCQDIYGYFWGFLGYTPLWHIYPSDPFSNLIYPLVN